LIAFGDQSQSQIVHYSTSDRDEMIFFHELRIECFFPLPNLKIKLGSNCGGDEYGVIIFSLFLIFARSK
jgi:hypothetical protein